MEELGIGRPSTYASILSVLQERDYVRLEQRRFIPEDRGRVVTAFLFGFFNRYIQYNFTAELEDKLDSIAIGEIDWKGVLREFWGAFHKAVEGTKDLKISNVIDALDEDLGPHFFPPREDGSDSRVCKACGAGRLGLKLGRGGPFIGCSNYPECTYTRPLSIAGDGDDEAASAPRELGPHPETGEIVSLRKGPFGFYVQLGEAQGKEKPKRVALPKTIPPAEIELDTAVALLSLPREIGAHPEDGVMILAGLGRYGPYLKHGSAYTSLGPDDDVLSIGLNRAVAVIREKPARGGAAAPLREIGPHPEDGKPVNLYKGRYGPYVKHGRVNASLPKDMTQESITLDEAVALLAARAAKGGKGRSGAKKAPARKAAKKAAKKAPAKKKKAPAKKPAGTAGADA
jgi:DNA topoisomerase-1